MGINENVSGHFPYTDLKKHVHSVHNVLSELFRGPHKKEGVVSYARI